MMLLQQIFLLVLSNCNYCVLRNLLVAMFWHWIAKLFIQKFPYLLFAMKVQLELLRLRRMRLKREERLKNLLQKDKQLRDLRLELFLPSRLLLMLRSYWIQDWSSWAERLRGLVRLVVLVRKKDMLGREDLRRLWLKLWVYLIIHVLSKVSEFLSGGSLRIDWYKNV